MSCSTTTSATVYFVDYGNSEDVEVSNISPPSGNFFDLPTQALCCTLAREGRRESGREKREREREGGGERERGREGGREGGREEGGGGEVEEFKGILSVPIHDVYMLLIII